jgi:hypothetical protein
VYIIPSCAAVWQNTTVFGAITFRDMRRRGDRRGSFAQLDSIQMKRMRMIKDATKRAGING